MTAVAGHAPMTESMSGRSRTIAVALAFTLAALLPASCPCAPQTTAHTGHECCAPSTAMRVQSDGCCGGAAGLAISLAAAPAPEMVAPDLAVSGVAPLQAVARFTPSRAAAVSPSPPPPILRI